TQISPIGHVPQLTDAPVQALLMVPQFLPRRAHSAGGGTGRHALPMHVWPDEHAAPQVSVMPHPLEMAPQAAPTASHVVVARAVPVLLLLSLLSPPWARGISGVPPRPWEFVPHLRPLFFLTQPWPGRVPRFQPRRF